MADAPLPTVEVTGSLGTGGAQLYNALAWFAQQVNYSVLNSYQGGYTVPTTPAPRTDPDLEEVVITGTAVPLEHLTDDELIQVGTDSAVDEWEARQADDLELAREQDAFVWPTVVYPATIAETALSILGRLALPIVGLFTDMPAGDRDLDEAPAPGGRRGPPIRPGDVPLDPIMPPNWEDLSKPEYDFELDPYPFGKPAPGPIPNPTDRQRRVLPIGDTPGLFGNPFEFQEFPDPLVVPRPRTIPFPSPNRPAPQPFGDPFAPVIVQPRTDPFAQPRPGPRPQDEPDPGPLGDPFADPFGDPIPNPIGDPVPGLPPRIGDPFTPGVPTLPVPLDPFNFDVPGPTFPGVDPISDPFLVPPGQNADPCNCGGDQKKKKKKKKPKPRDVCYRGTYRELRNGLSKSRLEEIPCEAASPGKKRKVPTTLDWRTIFGDPTLRS